MKVDINPTPPRPSLLSLKPGDTFIDSANQTWLVGVWPYSAVRTLYYTRLDNGEMASVYYGAPTIVRVVSVTATEDK